MVSGRWANWSQRGRLIGLSEEGYLVSGRLANWSLGGWLNGFREVG